MKTIGTHTLGEARPLKDQHRPPAGRGERRARLLPRGVSRRRRRRAQQLQVFAARGAAIAVFSLCRSPARALVTAPFSSLPGQRDRNLASPASSVPKHLPVLFAALCKRQCSGGVAPQTRRVGEGKRPAHPSFPSPPRTPTGGEDCAGPDAGPTPRGKAARNHSVALRLIGGEHRPWGGSRGLRLRAPTRAAGRPRRRPARPAAPRPAGGG